MQFHRVCCRSSLRQGEAFRASHAGVVHGASWPLRQHAFNGCSGAAKIRGALLYFGSHRLRGNRFRSLPFERFPCARIAISLSTRPDVPLHQSRVGILKNRSLWISVGAAIVTAAVLAGCGSTSYPDGRSLPPAGWSTGSSSPSKTPAWCPAVRSRLSTRTTTNAAATTARPVSLPSPATGAPCPSPSKTCPRSSLAQCMARATAAFISPATLREGHRFGGRPERAIVQHLRHPQRGLRVCRQPRGASVHRRDPIQRRFTWAQSSRRIPRQRQSHWNGGAGLRPEFALRLLPAPALRRANDRVFRRFFHVAQGRGRLRAAERPTWCLFQMQSPDNMDATGNYYGAPLAFDHPIKAVFSSDGGTAYILSCGPECGGATAAYTPVPIAPMIFLLGQDSGLLPTTSALATAAVPIPGGASNALVDSSTMYVVEVQNWRAALANARVPSPAKRSSAAISPSSIWPTTPSRQRRRQRRQPGATSRIIEADDNTLWIAMTGCDHRRAICDQSGERIRLPDHVATATDPATNKSDDCDGALYRQRHRHCRCTGLHKIYTAEGGQVYIYSTRTVRRSTTNS